MSPFLYSPCLQQTLILFTHMSGYEYVGIFFSRVSYFYLISVVIVVFSFPLCMYKCVFVFISLLFTLKFIEFLRVLSVNMLQ